MQPAKIHRTVICQGAQENMRQLFGVVPLDQAVRRTFHSPFTIGILDV